MRKGRPIDWGRWKRIKKMQKLREKGREVHNNKVVGNVPKSAPKLMNTR